MSVKTYIKGSHWLNADAAASWLRMVADGMPNLITSAGRSHDVQIRLFLENYTTDYSTSAKKDKKTWQGKTYWRRKVTTTGKATVSVATPGSSLHEKGNAVDVPASIRPWMHSNGEKYGWINPAWAKTKSMYEPWHFEYNPARDTQKNRKPVEQKGWDELATEKEIRDIVAQEVKKAFDTFLLTNIGTNPATKKPSNVRESLQIARNYSYLSWLNTNVIKDNVGD